MKAEDIQNSLENIKILDNIIEKTENALLHLTLHPCETHFGMTIKYDKALPQPENVLDADGNIKPEFLNPGEEQEQQQGFRSLSDLLSYMRSAQTKEKRGAETSIILDHCFMNEQVSIMVLTYMLKEYKAYRKKLKEGLEGIGITF